MSHNEIYNTKEYFITYGLMINAAQHHGFTTYQEIAQAVGYPTAGSYMGAAVGNLIGAVSENEITQGRPMLSAIVVGVSGKPGKGFIPYAKELGVLKAGEDETSFWEKECDRIYKEWKISYRISKTK